MAQARDKNGKFAKGGAAGRWSKTPTSKLLKTYSKMNKRTQEASMLKNHLRSRIRDAAPEVRAGTKSVIEAVIGKRR